MITFRIMPHSIDPKRQVIELWDGDVFVGQLTSEPTDNAVRLITKHQIRIEKEDSDYLNAYLLCINHPGGN